MGSSDAPRPHLGRLLLVTGSASLEQQVREQLKLDGYLVDVCAVSALALGRFASDPPLLALVDLNLEGGDAVALVRCLARGAASAPPTIGLAARDVPERVEAALRAGARGCLYADDVGPRLRDAIREALAGGSPVSRGMAALLVECVRRSRTKSSPANTVVRALTVQERRVLTQLARGYTYEDVARCLEVSINTVRTQVRAIYQKLDVSSRTEAVLVGMRLGLVTGTPFPGSKPRSSS